MQIRKCKNDDIIEIYNLICELKNQEIDYNKFKISFNEKLSDRKNYYFLAIENNNVTGFISLMIDYKLQYAEKVATIEELIVNSKYRNKGVGKNLLNKAIDCAKGNNCNIIELTSSFSREDAHKFYEKNGFKKISYKFKIKL